jgi:hypothetical protein
MTSTHILSLFLDSIVSLSQKWLFDIDEPTPSQKAEEIAFIHFLRA